MNLVCASSLMIEVLFEAYQNCSAQVNEILNQVENIISTSQKNYGDDNEISSDKEAEKEEVKTPERLS